MNKFPDLVLSKLFYYQWKADIAKVNREYYNCVDIEHQTLDQTFIRDVLVWKNKGKIAILEDGVCRLPKYKINSFLLDKVVVADLPKYYHFSNGSESQLKYILDLFR